MPDHCRLYYITDRTQFHGAEPQRRSQLLQKIADAVHAGVDYIQLREKDLPTRDLEILAREVIEVIRTYAKSANRSGLPVTRLLINSRTDLARAVGAEGVHLRSDDLSAWEAREIWNHACRCGADSAVGKSRSNSVLSISDQSAKGGRKRSDPIIAVSCHSVADILRAQEDGADFAVFAPVFEKEGSPKTSPAGLATLRQAGQHRIPVFALGGVTVENASACLQVGAAGIAAIRLFQENDVSEVVNALRRAASACAATPKASAHRRQAPPE
jgi:thiamine-phosphate pyrophosphorylase